MTHSSPYLIKAIAMPAGGIAAVVAGVWCSEDLDFGEAEWVACGLLDSDVLANGVGLE